MNRMHRPFAALVLSLVAVVASVAADLTAVPTFPDGEVVAVVGDSITHNGLWHRYVADYYATRFPTRTVRFINCGISGDTTSGVLSRLDGDVLIHHPTAAVVMLGMNDVGRNDYKAGLENDAAAVGRRAASLSAYEKNQTALEAKLRAGGVKRIIYLTPSPFDQTAKIEKENLPGVNDALGRCGTFLAGFATKSGAGLVDLNGPMTALNRTVQTKDPAATIIGKDRVHPGPPGNLVMAWLFLTAQGAPAVVSRVSLDAGAKSVGYCVGATVEGATWSEQGVTATITEEALPWPIEQAAQPALEWASITQDLNRQEFVCTGLVDGTYSLSIDAVTVGTWPAEALAKGINLAASSKTPQAIQAMAVQKLCEERRTINARLRSIPYVELKWFAKQKIDLNDESAVNAAIEAYIAKAGTTAGYYRTVAEAYRMTKPQAAAQWKRIDELASLIRETAKPKSHRFVLQALPGK